MKGILTLMQQKRILLKKRSYKGGSVYEIS